MLEILFILTLVSSGSDHFREFCGIMPDDSITSGAQFTGCWDDGFGLPPEGQGLNNRVHCIATNGSDVWVGGLFNQAGDVFSKAIVKWDGSSWSALGNGMNAYVYDIASNSSWVYAGGSFTIAGWTNANRIARWNGSDWYSLGSGVGTGYPYAHASHAIAMNGSTVYVGGFFQTAGGNPANNIASWYASWSALGSGVNSSVKAIALNGSDVYVGGHFTQAGGNPASYIARWDGSSWHPLGIGVSGGSSIREVRAIAVSDSNVYVGGSFTQAGGLPASNIACWVEQGTAIDPTEDEETPGILAIPNPIATGANLSFQSSGLSPLTLSVYDTAGRLVRRQDLGTLPAGSHSHYWDGREERGSLLASGVYFIRITSTELEASTRVVLIR